jgi:citrate lyase beta subunit
MRSVLYVPASKPKMLSKLWGLQADAFVIDLEDGVAPGEKDGARRHVRRAHAEGLLPGDRWWLRINGSGTVWHSEDLDLVSELSPPGAVLPKAEDPEEVADLAETWARGGTVTALMIETARGVGRTRELAGANPRVTALIYGSADLRRSLGANPDPQRSWELHVLSEILLAARMHGCLAVDAVHFRFRDLEALEGDARIARDLGYDGKSCIHPAQIDVIHRVFSSTPEETRWARSVLQAWDEAQGDRTGVVVVDGEMIEALHLDVARRILDREEKESMKRG